MDLVALFAAIASMFGGGGTVTPDGNPVIHVSGN
jgi:hypothetical protein